MVDEGDPAARPVTAGALLRQAREAQGLHIAVLAARLKLPQRKLEALEADRLGDLPDAMFARALAQTVCRSLKVDAAPVLALLPQVAGTALDQVSAGLNTPFRDKPSPHDQMPAVWIQHPAWVAVVLLLAAAAVVWFWPRDAALQLFTDPPVSASASADSAPLVPPLVDPASQPRGNASVSTSLSGAAASATSAAAAASTAFAPAYPVASVSAATVASLTLPVAQTLGDPLAPHQGSAVPLLALSTRDESWIEVVDASGRTLVSRVFGAGDVASLDEGALPFRVVIGNVEATELKLRGKAVDLVPVTGSNVARFELK